MKPDMYGVCTVLIGVAIVFLIGIIFWQQMGHPELLYNPTYTIQTIQDVELWCCNNVNASVSPTGENCTELTKDMIGAYCQRMRVVRG